MVSRRRIKTHLDSAVTDVDLLGVVLGVFVPRAVRDPVAEELAEYRLRRRRFPRDVHRRGGSVVGDRRDRFAGGGCGEGEIGER